MYTATFVSSFTISSFFNFCSTYNLRLQGIVVNCLYLTWYVYLGTQYLNDSCMYLFIILYLWFYYNNIVASYINDNQIQINTKPLKHQLHVAKKALFYLKLYIIDLYNFLTRYLLRTLNN